MSLTSADQKKIITLLAEGEEWLLERLYKYASEQEYTKYSSTLKEAWRMSIAGLSRVILAAAKSGENLELHPDADFVDDPACAFGVLEAQKHRARGVNLAMFLGLFKYFRQTYQDFLRERLQLEYPLKAEIMVNRIFDRFEIAFCTEWTGTDAESHIRELAGANRHLANQKNLFLTFFESLSHPAFLVDELGIIRHMNAASQHLLGGNEVPGAHYYSEDRKAEPLPFLQEELRTFLKSGSKSFSTEYWSEFSAEELIFEAQLHRLLDISGKYDGVAMTLVDITLRKQTQKRMQQTNIELETAIEDLQCTQEQFLQTEKMAAIGQLAAGIAHEINNPIGYVSTNFHQLARYTEDAFTMLRAYGRALPMIPDLERRQELEDLADELEIAYLAEDAPSLITQTMDGLDRVTRIIGDLKNFSRQAGSEWELASLNDLIDSTINVVWNQIKYKADLVRNYTEIPQIECFSGQVAQIIMNLVINSCHAIEDKGTITITTGFGDDFAWFEVADDGCGIPEDVLSRIFNPFFTTKPVGQGTGLGLSVAHGIVEKHQGRIEVKSVPGDGSEIRVFLPLVQVQKPEFMGGAPSFADSGVPVAMV